MASHSVYSEILGQVQYGPVYKCWVCDRSAERLMPYHDCVPPPTDLDAYADHLAYLRLPLPCRRQGHPARVVVAGPAITPVDWPQEAGLPVRLSSIEAGLETLTAALAAAKKESPLPGDIDRPLLLALQLHGRALNPTQGARAIRALVSP